jgi:hypothetical protein
VDLTQAVHAQTLIGWLTDPHATTPAQCDAARDAAAQLADAAHQLTHTGPTAAQVQHGWDNLLEGCHGCPDCTPNPDHDHDQDADDPDQDDDQGGHQDVDADGGPPAGLSEADVRQLVAQGWLAPANPVVVGQAQTVRGMDEEDRAWAVFLATWLDRFGTEPVKVADVLADAAITRDLLTGRDLDPWHGNFITDPAGRRPRTPHQLARILAGQSDRFHGDPALALRRGNDSRRGEVMWVVYPARPDVADVCDVDPRADMPAPGRGRA